MDEPLEDNNNVITSSEHLWTEQESFVTVTEHIIDVIVTNSVSVETYYPQFGPKRDSLYVVIPLTVIYLLIFLTGIIGNISTCIVIGRNKTMHTATNYYLFSLAISDLLLLVTGLPIEVYYLWSRYPYIFGEVFCVGRGLAAETSTNATVLTITAFTIERYVAICRPFLSHTMSKLSRAVRLILLIWFISLLIAIPQALQFGVVQHPVDKEVVVCIVNKVIIKHSFELHSIFMFVLPMTLITVLYILIGLRLRHSNMMKKESSGSSTSATSMSTTAMTSIARNTTHCRHHHQGQSSRRVLKMLVAVVVAFFLCWAPFHLQRLVAIYGAPMSPNETKTKSPMLRLYEIVTYISGVLYYVSTTINPMLYHLMSNKFRSAFKDTFSRWCCCCLARDPRQMMHRSYSALSQRATVGGAYINGRHHNIVSNNESGDYNNRGGFESRNDRHRANGNGGGRECGGSIAADHSTDCSGNSTCTLQHCNSFSSRQQSSMLSSHPGGGRTSTTSLNGSSLILSSSTQFSTILSPKSSLNEQQRNSNTTKRRRYISTSSCKNPSDNDTIGFGDGSYQTSPKRKHKLWHVFRCITRRHAHSVVDDDKLYYSQPLDINTTSSMHELKSRENFTNLSPCNISNSSLRDVERGALEDELTVYMQELQRRERENLYMHR